LNVGKWTEEEDIKLYELCVELGTDFNAMAENLVGRSAAMVKNRYYAKIKNMLDTKKHFENR
jgi:hypothetical protein